jgi:hypothetical protein
LDFVHISHTLANNFLPLNEAYVFIGGSVAVDSEKYKFLYEYQQEQFLAEKHRYSRLEDKSIRYLTSITIAVSAYVLIVRWAFERLVEVNSIKSWLTLISIVITIIAMCSAWSFIFRSIKLQKSIRMPSDIESIDYFKYNKKEVVYLGLAKKYSFATQELLVEIDQKLKNIKKGYMDIIFSAWSFLISITLIFITMWT